jgi:selenide,water dikinase
VGSTLATLEGVHAMTDVTGFGLAGHLLEICRGSRLAGEVEIAQVPVIDVAAGFAREGMATGASARNWAGYGADVSLDASIAPWQQALLTDPQTSGGLLVSCAPEAVDRVLAAFRADGFERAAVVGRMLDGAPRLQVR